MTSIYRDATLSVLFHLFQEFSTLGQQLAHTLSLRQSFGGVEYIFPARPRRERAGHSVQIAVIRCIRNPQLKTFPENKPLLSFVS
jgi:hypothetical protein